MAFSQQQPHQSPLHSILEPQTTARLTQSPPEPTQLDLKPILSKHRQSEEIVAFTLQDIISPKECQSFIDRSEAIGYDTALINGVTVNIPGYRDGNRCIIDDHAVAAEMWERIKLHVPAVYEDRPVIGMNERLRFLKYGPGDRFQPHLDMEFKRTDGSNHITKITVQFYLNQDFQGGATSFLEERMSWDEDENYKKVSVTPKPGQVLVFQHDLVHEGSKKAH
ncbi:hypothetical protein BGX27_008037 [Mortierella sp. AM989]|nr:hypothetical protein BGX27_008037 [Mortierella sp. AM989]